MIHRAEKYAQNNQGKGSPRRMPEEIREARSLRQSAGKGIGQRHANQKREARLNRVVQRAAKPLHVRLVVSRNLPELAGGLRR